MKFKKITSMLLVASMAISACIANITVSANEGSMWISGSSQAQTETVACTQDELCTAEVHEPGCPLYTEPAGTSSPETEPSPSPETDPAASPAPETEPSPSPEADPTASPAPETEPSPTPNADSPGTNSKDEPGSGDENLLSMPTPTPVEVTLTSGANWKHIYGLSGSAAVYPRVQDAGDITLDQIIEDLNKVVTSIKLSYTYTYAPVSQAAPAPGDTSNAGTVTESDAAPSPSEAPAPSALPDPTAAPSPSTVPDPSATSAPTPVPASDTAPDSIASDSGDVSNSGTVQQYTAEPVTVTRTNVLIEGLVWSRENMSFEEIEKALAETPEGGSSVFTGKDYRIYLNEDYILSLIKAYEAEQGMAEQLENAVFNRNNNSVQIVCRLGSNLASASRPTREQLDANTVSTVSPGNVTINLFDYWISAEGYMDSSVADDVSEAASAQTPKWGPLVTSGVNNGHALLFRKSNSMGSWNSWTGSSGGRKGEIVKNTLAANGFPQLNIGNPPFNATGIWNNSFLEYTYDKEETLQYLFDINAVNAGGYGSGYADVKGLFQINEDGNYYYSSHENFAEYDESRNRFNIYNTWGITNSGTSPAGQFFPFNNANIVFKANADGTLSQSNIRALDNTINHYLGLAMEVDFQQPLNGMVSVGAEAKPMVFDFSGDDDVWIFIDDVLIADLGGIHDEMKVAIDFSTGSVQIERAKNPNQNTTVKTTIGEQVRAAGAEDRVQLDGETLAGNTTHTLKMFYLERGNTDSNLTLSFNLLEPVESTIVKFDQNGERLSNAQFDLYIAQTDEQGEPIMDESTGNYAVGDLVQSSLITNENGECVLPNYDFSKHTYYVLRETVPPDGYFAPGDILLRYDAFRKNPDGTSSGTNLLMVENRWTTGAVSSFTATVYQAGILKYDNSVDESIQQAQGKEGLIIAVPLLRDDEGKWQPLYGTGMLGFSTVSYSDSGDAAENQRRAILTAALYQIYGAKRLSTEENGYDFPLWYLEWKEEDGRYYGVMEDLPGDADRYYWANTDPNVYDMTMAYYFLDLQNIDDSIINVSQGATTEQKFEAIASAIDTYQTGGTHEEEVMASVEQLVNKIMALENQRFGLLNIESFNRLFSSTIRVPDVQPELNVLKLDENGNRVAGVTFSLYAGDGTTQPPLAVGTTNERGLLTFSVRGTGEPGSAYVHFDAGNYTLQETAVPSGSGYTLNSTPIPVVVTQNGRVYADALEENDGITVRKGLGKLLQTVVRYANEGSVDVTLRDITAILLTGDQIKGNGITGMTPVSPTQRLDLHYGLDNALLEYGTHTVNGVTPNPYFEVDTDFAGIWVQQNYSAHEGDSLYDTIGGKIDLQDINIRGLFTGSTAVVVRNRSSDTGIFSITKTVTGIQTEQKFAFDVSIEQKENSLEPGVTWPDSQGYSYKVLNAEDGSTLETGKLYFTKQSDGQYRITKIGAASDYLQKAQGADCYQAMLGHNETLKVEDLPFGLVVTVSEPDSNGYRVSAQVNDGAWQQTSTASGVVTRPVGNPIFRFNNHKDEVADLTLEKFVPETSGDTTLEFPFNITLRDASGSSVLTDEYSYEIYGKNGDLESQGTTATGYITVKLASGEKVVIKDLPIGSNYIITETPLGYAPAVSVNGTPVAVVNGSVTGTIEEPTESAQTSEVNYVLYTNTRSGSITLTKRTGDGNILNGAGFTLYTVDESGKLTQVGKEQYTALAMRYTIEATDPNFNQDTMRYDADGNSYIVHTAKSETGTTYFYYRFLTAAEREQYNNGTLPGKENVEAIVEFTELELQPTRYAIRETTVPPGYTQRADFEETMSDITLPMGEEQVYDILYTVTNHTGMVLPVSGLTGITATLGAGVLLLGLAAGLGMLSLRRKKHIWVFRSVK